MDNDLVVSNGKFTDIYSLFVTGFLTGSGGITSSTSDGDQVLALFDNALTHFPTWAGEPIAAEAIVGKYTFFGDMNIDGQVTGDDYTVIDANLNTTPAVGLAWVKGDSNLDGFVTGDDYTVVDAHLGQGSGNPLSPNAAERRAGAGNRGCRRGAAAGASSAAQRATERLVVRRVVIGSNRRCR